MYRSNALLLAALIWMAGSFGYTSAAQAEVSQQELAGLLGRVVGLERLGGQRLLAKILRVDADVVVVELEDGTVGSIRLDILARVHTSLPIERDPVRKTPPTRPVRKARRYAPKHRFRVEWIGARGMVSILKGDSHGSNLELAGGAELVGFVLHWRYVYWECMRIGGGTPFIFHHGTALGIPIHLDGSERRELRVGAHFTLRLGYWPGPSGAQLYYMYRPSKKFGLQLGIMQHSSPLGFSITFGLSM